MSMNVGMNFVCTKKCGFISSIYKCVIKYMSDVCMLICMCACVSDYLYIFI